jgi:hypothetical protein
VSQPPQPSAPVLTAPSLTVYSDSRAWTAPQVAALLADLQLDLAVEDAPLEALDNAIRRVHPTWTIEALSSIGPAIRLDLVGVQPGASS